MWITPHRQCNDKRGGSHLDLWNNGAPLRAGASKCSEWSRGHQRTGPAKAAEITAGNIIFLMPHHNGIHDKKSSPRQPEGMLLGDEWCTLKVQGHCYAPIGHQVETGRETCRMQWRMLTPPEKKNSTLMVCKLALVMHNLIIGELNHEKIYKYDKHLNCSNKLLW